MTLGATITSKEFPATMAGERVGWVSFHPHDDQELPHLNVNIVTATVAPRGAWIGHYEDPGSSTELIARFGSTQEGFVATAGLSAMIVRGKGIERQRVFYRTAEGSQGANDSSLIQGGAASHYADFGQVIAADRQWAESKQGLLTLLKQGLAEHGALDNYADLYYAFNARAADPGQSLATYTAAHNMAADVLVLPDKDMVHTTYEQSYVGAQVLKAVTHVETTLQQAIGEGPAHPLSPEDLYALIVQFEQSAISLSSKLIDPELVYDSTWYPLENPGVRSALACRTTTAAQSVESIDNLGVQSILTEIVEHKRLIQRGSYALQVLNLSEIRTK